MSERRALGSLEIKSLAVCLLSLDLSGMAHVLCWVRERGSRPRDTHYTLDWRGRAFSCSTTAMSYRKSQPEYGNENAEDPNNFLNTVSPLYSQGKPRSTLDRYEMLYNASPEIGSNLNQSSPVRSNLSPGKS